MITLEGKDAVGIRTYLFYERVRCQVMQLGPGQSMQGSATCWTKMDAEQSHLLPSQCQYLGNAPYARLPFFFLFRQNGGTSPAIMQP